MLVNKCFISRRRRLSNLLQEKGLEVLIITQPANLYYLTGFTGEACALVAMRAEATLIMDGRFTVQAREEVRGVSVRLQKGTFPEAVGRFLRAARVKRLGYDPAALSVAQFAELRRAAGRGRVWKALSGLVEGLRGQKDSSEIAQMRKAARLASNVLIDILKLLKPGVREFEIAAEIEYQMRRRGASGPAFQTIVAFGERSALPHARPTGRKLGKKEWVLYSATIAATSPALSLSGGRRNVFGIGTGQYARRRRRQLQRLGQASNAEKSMELRGECWLDTAWTVTSCTVLGMASASRFMKNPGWRKVKSSA